MHPALAAADSIPYYTVFDVRDGYPHWTAEIGFALFGLALVIVLVAHARGWMRLPRPVRSGVSLVLLALVLVVLPAHAFAHRDYDAMCDAMRAGHFTVVEGRVENFQPPGSIGGRRKFPETFTVHSHKQTFRYSYLENQLAPGFNVPSDRDGPIRQSLQVRIADVDGRIARLEIAPRGAIARTGYIGESGRP